MRKHPNAGAIAVLNLLLGWTFIGWVIALVWSFTSTSPAASTVIYNYQPPQQRGPGGDFDFQ
jgi:hypothetical protein